MYGWRPITQILPPMNKAVQLLVYDPKTDKHYVSAGAMVKKEGSQIGFGFMHIEGISTLEILPVVAWMDLNHPDPNIRN
jgi:hypothetical protein